MKFSLRLNFSICTSNYEWVRVCGVFASLVTSWKLGFQNKTAMVTSSSQQTNERAHHYSGSSLILLWLRCTRKFPYHHWASCDANNFHSCYFVCIKMLSKKKTFWGFLYKINIKKYPAVVGVNELMYVHAHSIT